MNCILFDDYNLLGFPELKIIIYRPCDNNHITILNLQYNRNRIVGRRHKTMANHSLRTIYEEIGEDTIEELVNAFYPKVYADPNLIPIFSTVNIDEIMYKQKLFLTQFTGGPALFSEEFGPPMMRRRHLPHEITPTRAKSWLRCMHEAFEEIGLFDHPVGKEFYNRLTQVAAVMINTVENKENE